MDELLEKKVPHSAVAEQSVIGSMLIDSRCIPVVIGKLKPEDFYIEQNKDIYETILSMFSYGDIIDPVTILDRMKVNGVYTERSDSYLAELMRVTPTAANVLQYIDIVKDRSLLRRLAGVADSINGKVYSNAGDADTVFEYAEREIYNIRTNKDSEGLVPVNSFINDVYNELTKAGEKAIPGLETGLVDIDNLILGLNKSEFILIAARPAMGKTSLALNMALNVAKKEKKQVAIFSLEMSRSDLVKRFLSSEARVPLKALLTGNIKTEEWRRLADAVTVIRETEILIDDNPSLTVTDMNAACRRLKNLGLVVIDYLQLMSSSGSGMSYANESRTQVVSDISRRMKIMAKELDIPVLCLSQLSRESVQGKVRRPALNDLRESGAIEQDADVVIALHREGYYNKEYEFPNDAEAIILKNRKGATDTVHLNWIPEFTTFTSAETRHEDE